MVVLAFVSLLSVAAFAQDYPKFEVPVGFSFVNVHPNLAPITSFNVFGGGGGFVYNVNSLIGIKADFMGYTQGSGLRDQLKHDGLLAGNANGNVFTYMFGPQFKKHSGMFQPFGEALFGAAHTNAYATILTDEGKLLSGSGNNNGFAMEFGGGLDVPLTKTIQFRPVEVDYLATHFGANHVANYHAWQNNFKYVAGVNFTFGGK
jgi:hypothetical protein